MLTFDTETLRVLDTCYQGSDITRRRLANLDAAKPEPGETILDIGCGNGLLTRELARAVGPKGHVIGIDPSADMRNAAAENCAEFENVQIINGTADSLGQSENSVDKAVSVQVFEYLEDVPASLAAAFSVLRPGGRLVVGDMHYGCFAWHSEEPDRMRRMRSSWDQHFVHGELPARLPALMNDAGFAVDTVQPVVFTDTVLKPDGLGMMMLRLMERYAVDNGHVEADIARSWAEEQEELARQGKFFLTMTHFVIAGRKP